MQLGVIPYGDRGLLGADRAVLDMPREHDVVQARTHEPDVGQVPGGIDAKQDRVEDLRWLVYARGARRVGCDHAWTMVQAKYTDKGQRRWFREIVLAHSNDGQDTMGTRKCRGQEYRRWMLNIFQIFDK